MTQGRDALKLSLTLCPVLAKCVQYSDVSSYDYDEVPSSRVFIVLKNPWIISL